MIIVISVGRHNHESVVSWFFLLEVNLGRDINELIILSVDVEIRKLADITIVNKFAEFNLLKQRFFNLFILARNLININDGFNEAVVEIFWDGDVGGGNIEYDFISIDGWVLFISLD